MAINQGISAFPEAPNSATDTPQDFNTKANAFVNHQSAVYVLEVNTWATEANALAVTVNADAQTASTKAGEASASATSASSSASLAGTHATNAGASADASQLTAWEAEADKMTAESYAVEPFGVFVKVYTSDGDGTFTATNTSEYSSLHYSIVADAQLGANPVGAIIMFNPTLSAIPANYQLCDGTNGTPNMTDRFVIGKNSIGLGAVVVGGSNDAVNISHNHTFTGNALANHNHASGLKTLTDELSFFGDKVLPNPPPAYVTGAGGGSSQSPITESVSSGTPSGTVSTEGIAGTNLNKPAYVELAYIQRMS